MHIDPATAVSPLSDSRYELQPACSEPSIQNTIEPVPPRAPHKGPYQPDDIEHSHVEDDPRKWTKFRKRYTLATVSLASLLLTLSVNIYNPAINNIKKDLHATYQELSLTLSIYAIVQGAVPLIWSAFTEIYGRKGVYLISITLFIIGCGVAGAAKSIGILIAMRIIQAIGGSAVLTIGAATLADVYEPEERGTVMGIYYATPLLGPSLGPIIGGAATKLFSWRATFYFLAIFAGLSLITFVFFKDTFRRQRSLSYQNALRLLLKETEKKTKAEGVQDNTETEIKPQGSEEKNGESDIHLSFRHLSLVRPVICVMRRINNICILLASGLIFGGITYSLSYTAVRTFGAAPYNYGSLRLGLVLLALGIGSMIGSLVGGRWSDRVLPENADRLKSAKIMMYLLPASLVAYAWMAEKKVNIAGICVSLFSIGFSSIWIYSSTLAYIVDANPGRSSSAIACNSLVRGLGAFVAAEIAVPLQIFQDSLGDGVMYTLVAGIMLVVCGLMLILIAKGSQWRKNAEEREKMEHSS
ncbi:hypothetical protein M422DRAFT_221319 [Sphaerobolus stellatus SS14]|nr:hypothetical protein M422DRAFT_221319 [Sphaerobolus stellatus SS14]